MTTNLKESMNTAMGIDGAMAVALVDYRSGMCLAQAGSGMNLDLAAAGNAQVVQAKLKTMESLGLRKGIEDILITLVDQYHLIRLVPHIPGLFLLPGAGQEQGRPGASALQADRHRAHAQGLTPLRTCSRHALKNRRAATIARTAYDSRSVIS